MSGLAYEADGLCGRTVSSKNRHTLSERTLESAEFERRRRTSAFVAKLRSYADFSSQEARLLEESCATQRDVPAREDLIREGDKPGPVFVVLEGWACTYQMLPDGTRQITAFLVPGDCCDVHASILGEMDHSIATLTTARIAAIPRAKLFALMEASPAIRRAFWSAQLVDECVLRAWIVNVGRRDSVQRVAHLMCELYLRAGNVGLVQGSRLELPITQRVIGDALGLTSVHVNRVLRRLRLRGAIDLRTRALGISDIAKLASIAGFDERYLHRRIRSAA